MIHPQWTRKESSMIYAVMLELLEEYIEQPVTSETRQCFVDELAKRLRATDLREEGIEFILEQARDIILEEADGR